METATVEMLLMWCFIFVEVSGMGFVWTDKTIILTTQAGAESGMKESMLLWHSIRNVIDSSTDLLTLREEINKFEDWVYLYLQRQTRWWSENVDEKRLRPTSGLNLTNLFTWTFLARAKNRSTVEQKKTHRPEIEFLQAEVNDVDEGWNGLGNLIANRVATIDNESQFGSSTYCSQKPEQDGKAFL